MTNMMMRRQFSNAVAIRFKNLMGSVAVKLCLCIVFISSLIFSFWPYIRSNFTGENEKLKIYSNINFELSKYNQLEKVVSLDEADIEINYKEGIYFIKIYSDEFDKYADILRNAIWERNLQIFMENHINDVSEEELSIITNQNIRLDYNEKQQGFSSDTYVKLMIMILLILIMIIILISRIGARVAYDKGNQITEVILTSMTKNKLFYAEVISSFFVLLANLFVIIIPILIASLVKNESIATDFSFISFMIAVKVIIHLSIGILSLVILEVGLSSLSQRPEDSNASMIIVMIPLYVSFFYTVINLKLYGGFWSFVNYIPIVSFFNIFVEIVKETISQRKLLSYIMVNIILITGELFCMKWLYCKNISKE